MNPPKYPAPAAPIPSHPHLTMSTQAGVAVQQALRVGTLGRCSFTCT
jgi:hypothetical protein